MERGQDEVAELIGGELDLPYPGPDLGRAGPGVIGGRQGERETEAEAVVARFHTGQDLEVHGHFLARPDVAHGQVYAAVAVLLGQGGRMAIGQALFIACAASSTGLRSDVTEKPSPLMWKRRRAASRGRPKA